jgi:hypothetical protein
MSDDDFVVAWKMGVWIGSLLFWALCVALLCRLCHKHLEWSIGFTILSSFAIGGLGVFILTGFFGPGGLTSD